MKKLSEITITPELLKKVEGCKSAEELIKVATENDIEITAEEAKQCFETLSTGELNDDQICQVAGGCADYPDADRTEYKD